MHKNRKIISGFFLIVMRIAVYSAGINLPDISVLGDFTVQSSTDECIPDRNELTIRSIEVALQGYLYPEIRADVFLSMHRHEGSHEAEICEASVSFLRLFFEGLALQAGKIHVNFGKLNKIHQHERSFIDQPLALTNFFVPHGLVGTGGVINYLMPLPFFMRLEGGVFRVPVETHHHIDGEEPEGFGIGGQVFTARLHSGVGIGPRAELEVGASGVIGNGSHYLEHKDKAAVAGCDITIKTWFSAYRRLVFQNEIFYLNRQVPSGTFDRFGGYSFCGFQFNKYWDYGLRYDRAENALPDNNTSSMISAIGTYHFTETTLLRLQYGFDPDLSSHSGALQLVFGIGPHTHPLQ